MGQTPPLDELAQRKRILQLKMDMRRAEMVLYYHEITAPVRFVQEKFQRLKGNPLLVAGAALLSGWLLFSGRMGVLRRAASWVLPVVWPRLRGQFLNVVLSPFLKGFSCFR